MADERYYEQLNNEMILKKLEALSPAPRIDRDALKAEIKKELEDELQKKEEERRKIEEEKKTKAKQGFFKDVRVKDLFNRFYNNPNNKPKLNPVSTASVSDPTRDRKPFFANKEKVAVFLPIFFTALLFVIAFSTLAYNNKFKSEMVNNITVNPAQVNQQNTFNNNATIQAQVTVPTQNNMTLTINIAKLEVHTNSTT